MGSTLKIGQVVSFGVGGADKCALNLVKGLLALNEDIEITVFYNKYSHPRQDELFTNPSRFNDYTQLPIKLIEFSNVDELNQYDIDILNTHRSGNDNWFLPNFESTNFNFKIIETNFHGYNKTKSDFRVYPSQAILDHLEPCTIPYAVIPNPIHRKITNEDFREKYEIKDKFVYGRIARPDSNIYLNTNLLAYKKIESDDTVFLYVAPNAMAKIDASNLGIKNIIFVDPTSDEFTVSKLYNTFDVLCHSNLLGETFGNTIAEAMIHGKPVITHIGRVSWPQAHKELIGDKTELFITEDIINQYSNVMRQLKVDKLYYNEISNYLQTRANILYDYVCVARKYFELYKTILNG